MLWHGLRAPAVAGVGRQPVSVGTLPTRVPAAQPGPRVAVTSAVRHAVPGADRPDRRRRRGTRLAARPRRGRRRRGWPRTCSPPASTCCPAWPACAPRSAPSTPGPPGSWPACAPAPARCSATTPTSSSSPPTPSSRPAARSSPPAGRPGCWPAGRPPVADLGCAAGTDTIALARAGASVVAVDRDPVARALTAANVEALGLADRVAVVDADVVDLVAAAGRRGGRAAPRPPRPGTPGGRTPAAGPRPLVAAVVDRDGAAGPRAAVGGEGGARSGPRPRAGRDRGGVGLGRRLDRRGAAVGPRALGDLAAGHARPRRNRAAS